MWKNGNLSRQAPTTGRWHNRSLIIKKRKMKSIILIAAVILSSAAMAQNTSVRPFRVNIPEQALVDLRHRIAATKWPGEETVPDATQGVRLQTMHALAHYWQ